MSGHTGRTPAPRRRLGEARLGGRSGPVAPRSGPGPASPATARNQGAVARSEAPLTENVEQGGAQRQSCGHRRAPPGRAAAGPARGSLRVLWGRATPAWRTPAWYSATHHFHSGQDSVRTRGEADGIQPAGQVQLPLPGRCGRGAPPTPRPPSRAFARPMPHASDKSPRPSASSISARSSAAARSTAWSAPRPAGRPPARRRQRPDADQRDADSRTRALPPAASRRRTRRASRATGPSGRAAIASPREEAAEVVRPARPRRVPQPRRPC